MVKFTYAFQFSLISRIFHTNVSYLFEDPCARETVESTARAAPARPIPSHDRPRLHACAAHAACWSHTIPWLYSSPICPCAACSEPACACAKCRIQTQAMQLQTGLMSTDLKLRGERVKHDIAYDLRLVRSRGSPGRANTFICHALAAWSSFSA